jgi:hypothetical protein
VMNLCDVDMYVIKNNILPFLTNQEYIQKAYIFDKYLNRKMIIRKYAANRLNSKINSQVYFDDLIFAPIVSINDYITVTNDFIEDILDERLLSRCDLLKTYPKINMKKIVLSSTVYHYSHHHNVIPVRIDFTSNQEVFRNIDVCSTYRLSRIQKRILIKNYPYAKALIY